MMSSSSPTLVSHSFSPENAKPQTKHRCSAYYEPSIWGDRFLHFSYDNMALDVFAKQIEELKEKARPMLSVDGIKPTSNVLNLIDTIQRLGVAYHFKKEIDTALEHVFNDHAYYDDDDLSTTALHFRVLRQHGYNASCDVFGQYKDNDGKFKTSLINDVPGMLSLYEATHLRVPGEEIMDEALEFTSSHLMSMVNHSSLPFEKQVTYALRHPIYKNMPRLEARRYIGIYQQDDKHNEVLLQLAKLDFNLLQSLHLRELSDLSKWWKSLQFSSKLPFARDRLVECYFWVLGVYFEPNFSLARNFLTKVIAMTSIIDDIYDSYGILDELLLFTDAIERWDISAIDLLPEYMKVCYCALLEVYNEIEDIVTKEGRLYCVEYAKESMKDIVQAYLIEEKWHDKGYIPTTEEYMKNSLISSGYPLLTVVSFIGMGDIVPEEAFHWVKNDVIPVKASALICRLMDDIVSHEFEQKRGHVASAIECYMKEYNVREEDACKEFNIRIDQAWKDLNLGCLKPTVVPLTLLERVVNLSRMMDVMYKHDDGYTNVGSNLKEYISSLLVTSIPM